MRRAVHVRNLIVALTAVVAILLTSSFQSPVTLGANVSAVGPQAPLHQAADFFWDPPTATINAAPGDTVTFNSALDNNGPAGEFDITVVVPSGWPAPAIIPASTVIIPVNGSVDFSFLITVPSNTASGNYVVSINATRRATGARSAAAVTIRVAPATATPTRTSTPTATVGPSPTPPPVCLNGQERDDPGNDMGSARLILVDVTEQHGICVIGDEDWFKFGAIGGKVYTIDVPEMDDGLDLSIDLYDDQGNRLTSNDDFFNRTPPDPSDIRPRIQSWTAPRDGIYFFRIRDTLNLGGGDRSYTVIVISESYGPTPITIPEICRDLYEEDGLPEEATLITSNEVQPAHVLCPAGDADWVRFFGKAGKTYYLYTDTRPYRNNPDINQQTEAGADTVLYLADRDGVSIIDFNDDLAGGGSLDSEIRFTPTVDGFYYAQVKNVGDIGNQFIRYDLVLKLCVPGQECGRSPITQVAPTAPPVGTSTPTPTEISFLDETSEAELTAEAQTEIALDQTDTAEALTETAGGASFSQSTLKPGPMVNGPLKGFADPAFERVWQRTDRPVAEQRATRGWIWGPRGLMARTEGYLQSASGLRQVQYFDKARMEVNNPTGDRNSKWFVTTGLLVVELISGRTQIGDQEFVQHAPADIPIAGDLDDPNAPTYASFANVVGQAAGDRSGQLVAETIDRAGQVGSYGGSQRPETRLVHFVPETGHNIPQVFWDFLNANGIIYEGGRYRNGALVDWVFTMGYPISEPYWTRIRVGGVERDVLVQAFQRRVLTYTPDNPRGWQVEMGNVGRHYYLWRYGEELPS